MTVLGHRVALRRPRIRTRAKSRASAKGAKGSAAAAVTVQRQCERLRLDDGPNVRDCADDEFLTIDTRAQVAG